MNHPIKTDSPQQSSPEPSRPVKKSKTEHEKQSKTKAEKTPLVCLLMAQILPMLNQVFGENKEYRLSHNPAKEPRNYGYVYAGCYHKDILISVIVMESLKEIMITADIDAVASIKVDFKLGSFKKGLRALDEFFLKFKAAVEAL